MNEYKINLLINLFITLYPICSIANSKKFHTMDLKSIHKVNFAISSQYKCGGTKTWALALGLSLAFYQQYVRGEEIMGEPHN